MHSRHVPIFIAGLSLALLPVQASAYEFTFEGAGAPTCSKVCKLVCETKKLSAMCYACECDEICIPGPSRPGCKRCATCDGTRFCGESGPACSDCQSHAPACEFCWRDWFAGGCAKPRTVKVLTKYQAEKEICWYHWVVVDAACCGCFADGGRRTGHRGVYKPAPVDAKLGDVLTVSDEEWSELASLLRPNDAASGQPASTAGDEASASATEPKRISIAERMGRLFTR